MARSALKNYRFTARDIANLERIQLEMEANPPPGLGKITEAAALRFAIATTHALITGTGAGTVNPLSGAATGGVPVSGAETPPAEAKPPEPARRSRPRKTG